MRLIKYLCSNLFVLIILISSVAECMLAGLPGRIICEIGTRNSVKVMEQSMNVGIIGGVEARSAA